MQNPLQWAARLAEEGYYVLPVKGKIPLIKWKTGATNDVAAVRAMDWSRADGVAISTEPTRTLVVDLDAWADVSDDGTVNEECSGPDLLDYYNRDIAPDTADDGGQAFLSSSGNGVHIFYHVPEGQELPASTVGKLGFHVDTRCRGGIVVLSEGAAETLVGPTEHVRAPQWIIDKTAAPTLGPSSPPREPRYTPGEDGTRYGLGALKAEADRITRSWETESEGFNETLNDAAFRIGQLVAGGELYEDSAHATLRETMRRVGVYSNQYKTLDSGFYSGMDYPRSASDESDSDTVSAEDIVRMSEELLTRDQFHALPEPEWLIEGWLERNSFVHLIGQANVGKTFVAWDLCERLAAGLGWPNAKETRPDRLSVVYLAAEGAHGVAQRSRAWETAHGRGGDVKMLPRPVIVARTDGRGSPQATREWKIFHSLMKRERPDIIVLDTQARVTSGLQENSALEMGIVVELLESLRRDTGACVILVHHTGKGEIQSARGSSALVGAVSTEIRVEEFKERPRIRCTKQKNAERPGNLSFQLVPSGESVVPEYDTVSTRRALVEMVLRKEKGWMRTNDIVEGSGVSAAHTQRLLKDMVQRGVVETRTAPGRGAPNEFKWVP